MSADIRNKHLNSPESLGDDDGMNLDLELERVIKHLDEAMTEPAPSLTDPEPIEPPEPKRPPVVTARSPVPVKDPRPVDVSLRATLLTDRIDDPVEPPEPLVKRGAKPDVIDLIDEIDGDHYDDQEFADVPPPSVKTVADLAPEELGELIAQAVETALRRCFPR